jgi:hypothetical protein
VIIIKAPNKSNDVKDEPGAEERFMRGIKKALQTPRSRMRSCKQNGVVKEESRSKSGD